MASPGLFVHEDRADFRKSHILEDSSKPEAEVKRALKSVVQKAIGT